MTKQERETWGTLQDQWAALQETYPARGGVKLELNDRIKYKLGYCRFRRGEMVVPPWGWTAELVCVARWALKDSALAMDSMLHGAAHALASREAITHARWGRNWIEANDVEAVLYWDREEPLATPKAAKGGEEGGDTN